MDFETFNHIVKDLDDNWPRAKLNDFQKKKIYEKCKRLDPSTMRYVIGQIIDNCKHPPSIAEFKTFIPAVEQAVTSKEVIMCVHCGDSGITNAVDRKSGDSWFIRCHCSVGEACFWDILPRWSSNLVSKFKIKAMDSDGQNEWKVKTNMPLKSQADYWKAKIKLSRDYWESYGIV